MSFGYLKGFSECYDDAPKQLHVHIRYQYRMWKIILKLWEIILVFKDIKYPIKLLLLFFSGVWFYFPSRYDTKSFDDSEPINRSSSNRYLFFVLFCVCVSSCILNHLRKRSIIVCLHLWKRTSCLTYHLYHNN